MTSEWTIQCYLCGEEAASGLGPADTSDIVCLFCLQPLDPEQLEVQATQSVEDDDA